MPKHLLMEISLRHLTGSAQVLTLVNRFVVSHLLIFYLILQSADEDVRLEQVEECQIDNIIDVIFEDDLQKIFSLRYFVNRLNHFIQM